MNAERFRRIEDVFHRVLGYPADERSARLAEACGADAELRRAVERLLAADERAGDLAPGLGFPDPAAGDPLVGATLGRWRIDAKLAEGGMGVVYRAARADGVFDQLAAVKVLRGGAIARDAARRFDKERRLLARLEHPNIARVLDGGTTETGTPYLVMELIDGVAIDRYCDAERLGVEDRLGLFVSVCRAAQFAHRNLVLHRDLKPSNVLVDHHGQPKLLDFGIARLLGQDDLQVTQTAARLLTPEYASPEQLRGESLTTASDVYSLGVLLYELLCGRRPHDAAGRSPGEWERTVAEDRVTRPSTAVARTTAGQASAVEIAARRRATVERLRRTLRGDLDRIVLMALRKEPERRYSSAEQLADDLERHLAGRPVLAREDTIAYRTGRFVRRNRLAVGAAAAVALALCFALFESQRGRRRAERASELARAEKQRAEAAAGHAQVEADSFRMIAEFLGDTFLNAATLEAEKERVRGSVLRHAERVRRQYAGDPHLRANLIDALGQVCTRLALFEPAEALAAEALEIRTAAFGADSVEVALSLTSIGTLAFAQGDHRRAVDAFAEALAIQRRAGEGVHTDVPLAENNLAAALRNVGRLEEARALHESALAGRRVRSGPASLPVAESLNNLAVVLLDLRRPGEARAAATEALAIRRAILGAEHSDTLQTMVVLAGVEWRERDLDRAAALLEEAARGYRALRDRGAEGLRVVLSNLAAVHIERDRPEAALPLAEEALAVARERLGPGHVGAASALTLIATIHQRLADHERAADAWREVVAILEAAYPEGHPRLTSARVGHGIALCEAANPAAAEPVLRAAIAGIGDDTDLLRRTEMALGACLAALGRGDEARPLLERALAYFERHYGTESEEAAAARKHLAVLGG